MTIQLDRPISRFRNDISATSGTGDAEPVFLGGWSAALGYYQQPAEPVTHKTTVSNDAQTENTQVNIFGPQVGLRNKISAYRARRRLNRSFRRNQREFENVMGHVAHDSAAQRELQTIWTLGH